MLASLESKQQALVFGHAIPMPVVFDHIARADVGAGHDQPAMALLLDLLRDGNFWVKLSGADKISLDPDAAPRTGLPYGAVVPYARAVIAAAPFGTT